MRTRWTRMSRAAAGEAITANSVTQVVDTRLGTAVITRGISRGSSMHL